MRRGRPKPDHGVARHLRRPVVEQLGGAASLLPHLPPRPSLGNADRAADREKHGRREAAGPAGPEIRCDSGGDRRSEDAGREERDGADAVVWDCEGG